jgi:hypothetical protein
MHLDLASALNLISTLAIVGALIFTGLQVREANRARRDQASVAVIQATQSESWTRALDLLGRLPENAGIREIEEASPETQRALFEFGVRLETIAYMVYRRIVDLHTVDELIGGVTLMFWSRAKMWTDQQRERTGNAKFLEWCQWLTTQVAERHAKGLHRPAYARDLHWRE